MQTSLPQLWEVFELVVSISEVSESGFLTLSSLNVYMQFNEAILQVTHKDFWNCMSYFLYRRNEDIQRRIKARTK